MEENKTITDLTDKFFDFLEANDYSLHPKSKSKIKEIIKSKEKYEFKPKLDYEIVSTYQKHLSSLIYQLVKNKRFGNSFEGDVFCQNGAEIRGFEMIDLINKGKFQIHSIKRISDNKIFSIGDICCPKHYENNGNDYPIDKFEIIQDNILRISSKNWYLDINNLVKVEKEFLLKTLDNFDIFMGDEYFSIYKKCNKDNFLYRHIAKPDHSKDDNFLLFFKIKENAEKYILENTPVLSVNDIIKVLPISYGEQVVLKNEVKKIIGNLNNHIE